MESLGEKLAEINRQWMFANFGVIDDLKGIHFVLYDDGRIETLKTALEKTIACELGIGTQLYADSPFAKELNEVLRININKARLTVQGHGDKNIDTDKWKAICDNFLKQSNAQLLRGIHTLLLENAAELITLNNKARTDLPKEIKWLTARLLGLMALYILSAVFIFVVIMLMMIIHLPLITGGALMLLGAVGILFSTLSGSMVKATRNNAELALAKNEAGVQAQSMGELNLIQSALVEHAFFKPTYSFLSTDTAGQPIPQITLD